MHVFALGETPAHRLGDSTDRNRLTERLSEAGIPWRTGPARGMLSLVRATRWLRAELRQFKPNIIQSMLFHADVVTSIANRQLGVPHIGGSRVVQPQRWRRMLHRWAANQMRKIVCVSQSVADFTVRLEGVEAEKLVVIPNGIRLDADFRQEPKMPPLLFQQLKKTDAPFLLFVGRLSEQKGILPLIKCADRMLDALPDHHMVLLGDGPLRKDIEAAIVQFQFAQRIHLLGWQQNARQWMSQAHLLLLPSNYEGMPNVVLEAMSESCPVVMFNVEGAEELLGSNNIQIVHGELTNFIDRTIQLARNRELVGQLQVDNHKRIQQFRLEDQLLKYEQLYLGHLSSCIASEKVV